VEFICDDDYRPLIPNGKYTAQCIDYDSKFCLGKRRKLFLNFVILEGEHQGKKLFQAFNMPYDGRIKTGSKYYKSWCMVNGWQPPTRNAKMSPRLFKNKIFTIATRTVYPPIHPAAKKSNKVEVMPEAFWYSVVDKILCVNAG